MDWYGGAETVVSKLATYLTKKGIENAILTLSKPRETIEEHRGLHMITPRKTIPYKMWGVDFSGATRLAREIIAMQKLFRENINGFDLVNVHNFPATWSIFPKRAPCVWMCNEPPDLWYDSNDHSVPMKIMRNALTSLDKFFVNKCIDVICVADEFNAKRAFTRYDKQAEIIHYGIEYELFSSGDKKKAMRKFNLYNNFILLQVGMITPSKNQFESVKAVEKLRNYIPNIKLVLAGLGNGPYEEMIKKYIYRKGLKKHIVFTGHIPKQMLKDLYHVCDIALFPIKSQGGWLSPFEALCASKPIIVSTEMTASDIITRKGIGIVTDDIVKAVLDIYNNPKPYWNMAKRGRRFAAENLTWDKFCQKMLTVFENALSKKNRC
ncbi:MAG: glycosyltransferase family 4 protein [Candidatus Heimdallarchaeota archaeon]